MTATFKLPRLTANQPIVDGKGRPTSTFLRWLNIDWANRIEAQEARQDTAAAALAATVASIQAAMAAAQLAQQTANAAQASADAGPSATARSGSLTDLDVNLSGTGWVAGPLVGLTTVSAGTLTITGSTPLNNNGSHVMTGGTTLEGEYRIVEVVLGVDDVRFTGTFTATDLTTDEATPIIGVANNSAAAVAAFSEARTSTGSVDYRMDLRRVSGATSLNNIRAYLNVRRS